MSLDKVMPPLAELALGEDLRAEPRSLRWLIQGALTMDIEDAGYIHRRNRELWRPYMARFGRNIEVNGANPQELDLETENHMDFVETMLAGERRDPLQRHAGLLVVSLSLMTQSNRRGIGLWLRPSKSDSDERVG